MGFFEFAFESEEAAAAKPAPSTSARRPSPAPTTSPAGRGTATSRAPSGSTAGRGTTPAGRGGSTVSRSAARPSTTAPASPGRDARPSGSGGGFSFDQFARYLRQGWGAAQQGLQVAQQYGAFGGQPAPGGPSGGVPGPDGQPPAGVAPAPPGGAPAATPDTGVTPPPYTPAAASTPPAGTDQLAAMQRALQQHEIPPLPGAAGAVAPGAAPPAVSQLDAMTLLRTILGNPQFQQALQLSAVMGAPPRTVELPVPAAWPPGYRRAAPIPMGAVMNAISRLAAQSMTDLNAGTREDEPEVPPYLIDEAGDFIVDPARPEDRAALVAHMFRLSDEALKWDGDSEMEAEADEEMDETDQWAREAGFA